MLFSCRKITTFLPFFQPFPQNLTPHFPPADSRKPAASPAKSGGRRRAGGAMMWRLFETLQFNGRIHTPLCTSLEWGYGNFVPLARGEGDARIQSHKFLKYLQNKAIPSSTTRFSSSERHRAYFISSKASIIFWMAAIHSRISFNPSGYPCLSKSRNVTRREAIRRANVFLVFHTSSIGKSCLWLQFVVPSPFFFFIF